MDNPPLYRLLQGSCTYIKCSKALCGALDYTFEGLEKAWHYYNV